MAKKSQPVTFEEIKEAISEHLNLEGKLALFYDLKVDIDETQESLKAQFDKIQETKTKMNGK